MKTTLLCLITLLFTACSPKYEIKTHYTLPTNNQGTQCVQTCSDNQNSCQSRCDAKEDNCLALAEQHAQESYPQLMDEYENRLIQYDDEMNRYDRETNQWERQSNRLQDDVNYHQQRCTKNKKDTHECQKVNEIKKKLKNLRYHQPSEPQRPLEPSLSAEIQEAQKSCNNECGCQQAYDTCFGSCGGTVTYEKFCVENCK